MEEVGPNRAAAEWLLKCGAQVKFVNWGSYVNDFNKIPPGGFEVNLLRNSIFFKNIFTKEIGLDL